MSHFMSKKILIWFDIKLISKNCLLLSLMIFLTSCGANVRKKNQEIQNINKVEDFTSYLEDVQQNTVPPKPVKLSANDYYLSPNESLSIKISKQGYTRFSIEDERITDVFVYPQESVQVRIHNQGYLVLVPNEKLFEESVLESGADLSEIDIAQIEEMKNFDEIKDQEIYITITGELGTTQDFFLRFTGGRPEPVRFVKQKLGNNLTKEYEYEQETK
jgi:hypothetical protein